MKNIDEIACSIVDLFDIFLAEKGIAILCDDPGEEHERRTDNENYASLYGMEYWGLVDKVEDILSMETDVKGQDN